MLEQLWYPELEHWKGECSEASVEVTSPTASSLSCEEAPRERRQQPLWTQAVSPKEGGGISRGCTHMERQQPCGAELTVTLRRRISRRGHLNESHCAEFSWACPWMQPRSRVKTEGGNFSPSAAFNLTPQFSFAQVFSVSEQTETGPTLANCLVSHRALTKPGTNQRPKQGSVCEAQLHL